MPFLFVERSARDGALLSPGSFLPVDAVRLPDRVDRGAAGNGSMATLPVPVLDRPPTDDRDESAVVARDPNESIVYLLSAEILEQPGSAAPSGGRGTESCPASRVTIDV